jgi:RNA polymerase sigma factor (TIGR02999 family)
MPTPPTLEELLRRANEGDAGARDELFASAYADLKRIAHLRLLREGGRSTVVDTTAVVHESYIRIARGKDLRAETKAAFLRYASDTMRSVIIDAVRERQALRRGGDLHKVTLDPEACEDLPAEEEEILDVDAALKKLAKVEPRLARVAEMRYFSGFTELQIADALEMSECASGLGEGEGAAEAAARALTFDDGLPPRQLRDEPTAASTAYLRPRQ